MLAEQFEPYRPLLFSLAYRMLGTVTDAEDAVQDTYLRIQQVSAEAIKTPKYYLTTVITRLCINRLKSARSQREEYLGPWLPEPIFTDTHSRFADPAGHTMHHDSISIAFLVLLESLSPTERAVFLLHDVFDYKYREIAAILDQKEATCRQLGRRARQHLAQRRPRFTSDPEAHEQLLQGFINVTQTGDIDAFLQLLAADVTFVPDGGGERGAAVTVLHGREGVAAFIMGIQRIAPHPLHYSLTTMNGQRAILARTNEGKPYFAVFLYEDNHQVRLLYVIAGRKLQGLAL